MPYREPVPGEPVLAEILPFRADTRDACPMCDRRLQRNCVVWATHACHGTSPITRKYATVPAVVFDMPPCCVTQPHMHGICTVCQSHWLMQRACDMTPPPTSQRRRAALRSPGWWPLWSFSRCSSRRSARGAQRTERQADATSAISFGSRPTRTRGRRRAAAAHPAPSSTICASLRSRARGTTAACPRRAAPPTTSPKRVGASRRISSPSATTSKS